MTATEKLRKLLDERGVEWADSPLMRVGGMERGTVFDSSDGRWIRVTEALDGTLCASHLTPEQAIAATIGEGTCHDTEENPVYFTCSECGGVECESLPRFCPSCGRKVVDE